MIAKKATTQSVLDVFLNELFSNYLERVPDVKKITNAMIDADIINSTDDIVNDHIAFRTMGVPNLGIRSFEKILLAHGYQKKDHYYFAQKKLDAYWYAPPSPEYPRVFLSELRVNDLSPTARAIIRKYTDTVTSDPVDQLDLQDGQAIGRFFHTPLWSLPTKAEYETLLEESEYAAWVIYNRYYLNHYTISVHELKEPYAKLENFNFFLNQIGIRLNDAGGVIKTSKDQLLRQSSSVAKLIEAQFADGSTKMIAGSYVEFAERKPLPAFGHLAPKDLQREQRRDGFEAANADKIFESTYVEQVTTD